MRHVATHKTTSLRKPLVLVSGFQKLVSEASLHGWRTSRCHNSASEVINAARAKPFMATCVEDADAAVSRIRSEFIENMLSPHTLAAPASRRVQLYLLLMLPAHEWNSSHSLSRPSLVIL